MNSRWQTDPAHDSWIKPGERSFSMDTLAEMCRAHFVPHAARGGSGDDAEPRLVAECVPVPSDPGHLVDVVVRGGQWEGQYRVDRLGQVRSFRIGGRLQPLPDLFRSSPGLGPNPVPTPAEALRWPSQDQVDRSRHVVLIAQLAVPPERLIYDEELGARLYDLGTELQTLTERVLSQAVATHGTEEHPVYVTSESYQIGPAAGGLLDLAPHVVTICRMGEPVLDLVGRAQAAVLVGKALIGATRALRRWASEQQIPGLGVTFVYSPADLESLCLHHIRTHYHRKAELTTEWECLTEDFHYGYQSPAHPTGNLEYLVLVKSKKKTYKFKVLGNGEVTELTVRGKKSEELLPPPDLFEDETAPLS